MEEKMEYKMKVIMEELEGLRKREEEWKRRIEELDKKWMKRMSMKGGRTGIGREGKEVRGWGKRRGRRKGGRRDIEEKVKKWSEYGKERRGKKKERDGERQEEGKGCEECDWGDF